MNMTHQWFTLVVIPTREMSIAEKLRRIIENQKLTHLISDVRVITVEKEMKNGTIKEKIHPDFTQYIFVKMEMSDITYNVVKINGVLHILGDPEPEPMTEEEAKKLFG